MSGRPFRVGIAGYGVVGQRRRAVMDAHQGMKVVALSDIQFSANGIDEQGVHRCQSYTELFDQTLDVLFVSLPNDVAADATVSGLKKGLHVFGDVGAVEFHPVDRPDAWGRVLSSFLVGLVEEKEDRARWAGDGAETTRWDVGRRSDDRPSVGDRGLDASVDVFDAQVA